MRPTPPSRSAPDRSYSILVYCGDVLGLGHLRRNTAIVSRLVEDLPGSNAVLLTSLGPGPIEFPSGVDVVKLPSLTKGPTGEVVARTLTVEQRHFRHVRRSIIEGLAQSLRPDLVLVDHFPGGVGGELLPILTDLRSSPQPPRVVLGLRDILDDPRVVADRWQDAGAYETIRRLYDAVLIYGSRAVFDADSQYRLGENGAPDVMHCGYVCSETATDNGSLSRRELGLQEGRLVVITAGGGTDGHPMMALCLDALRQLGSRPDFEVVCITGPFMSRDRIRELRARAAGLPVRVLWCVEQAPQYFRKADLVVTMAGYNTLIEAVGLGKRTLVLPRAGPSAEQAMRCEIFSQRGWIRCVRPEQRTPVMLSGLILEALERQDPPATRPDLGGLERVVRRLRTLLELREAGASVAIGRTDGSARK